MLASFGPHPNEDQVWQVVDKYTQAVGQTEESDIFNECQAHARLGMIFDKYLKLRHKAVLNCKRAVQLGHTIRPRPIGADWFMVSLAFSTLHLSCVCKTFGKAPEWHIECSICKTGCNLEYKCA